MKAKTKTASSQPFLLVDSEVVRKIRQHARSSHSAEICGVLIGHDKDQRIEVTASIEGENAEEAGAHVTFTQDTWEHIYAVKDRMFPNDRIVGWYHSHPGFGVFLSEHDTFIHKNFFSSPGQVAWVFDPQSDEEGCFGWVEGNIERLTRIAVQDRRGGEKADGSGGHNLVSSSFTAGNGAAEHNPELGNARVRVMHVEAGDADADGSSSLEQLVTKVFFSLTLLVLGGLLSWYLLPHTILVPVLIDPSNGKIVDVQTGEVIGQLQQKTRNPEPGAPAQSSQASTPSGSKGDNAKSK